MNKNVISVSLKNSDTGEIEKLEGQAWLCLYNVLSTPEVMDKYQLNSFRIGVLTRLQSRFDTRLIIKLNTISQC